MTQVQFRKYAAEGNVEMVKKGLTLKSIDPSKRGRQGDSAIGAAMGAGNFREPNSANHNKVVELLLQAGVIPNSHQIEGLALYGQLETLKIVYKYYDVRIDRHGGFSSCVNNGHYKTAEFILNHDTYNLIDNNDLLQIMVEKINWMSKEMFDVLWAKITDPSKHNNKFILDMIDKDLHKLDVDYMISKFIEFKSVTNIAVENNQTILFPQTVKDMFLF